MHMCLLLWDTIVLPFSYKMPAFYVQDYNKLRFFEEEKIYWAPASTKSDLYMQLASKKYREIPRNQIK